MKTHKAILIWGIPTAIAITTGFLLFGGACWNSDDPVGKRLMLAGLLVSPLSSVILFLYVRPRLALDDNRKQMWTALALFPLGLLAVFLCIAGGLFVFVRLFFANGLD